MRCIKACECPEELHEWSQCLRKKWILTQRAADARIKHHKLFYAGGDVSHQAFIDNLTKQKLVLEEKLLRIDERAYEVRMCQFGLSVTSDSFHLHSCSNRLSRPAG